MECDFNHEPVLARLSGLSPNLEVMFLPCRDSILRGRVRFRLLEVGSLHPLAAATLRVLERVGGTLPLDQIAAAIGCHGRHGVRFTSEMMDRLVRARQVRVVDQGKGLFAAPRMSAWGGDVNNVKSVQVERNLCYVPRSDQLANHIPRHRISNSRRVNWWNPPDGDPPYAGKVLEERILHACRRYVETAPGLSVRYGQDANDEVLKRCGLLLRKPLLMEAEILEPFVRSGKVVHRCYFCTDASKVLLWIEVYRFMDDQPVGGYSSFLKNATRDDAYREKLVNAAVRLKRGI